jgi:hypothetical protein
VIIGISGQAGSGKDVVASDLVKNHRFVQVALADPVKRAARHVYDFSVEQLWGPSPKRAEPDTRYPREHGPWTEDDKCLCCGVAWGQEAKKKQCYLTPRFAIQTLGTEWGRGCYLDTWVDYTIRTAKRLLGPQGEELRYDPVDGIIEAPLRERWRAQGVVVSDIRFRNELDAIRAAGSKLWRVRRVGHEKPKWNHTSETEQQGFKDEEFDVVLKNNGTLADLHELVSKSMMTIEVLEL